MNKRIISAVVSLAMVVSLCSGFAVTASAAAAKAPKYQTAERRMEELNRGLIAVKTETNANNGITGGVYLSWRLLGTESLENQAFDIYRNGQKIHTTGTHDATCYTDTTGMASDTYKVVKAGATAAEVEAETAVSPSSVNRTARGSLVGNGTSEKNSYTYFDVPIQIPDDVARMGDGKTSTYKRGSTGNGANDASVGDLDGDGDYEIVLKWDPSDSKDSAGADFTGNVYIDAYEITANTDNLMWRIDLGKNVTAGQHYTQFMVYDFDGDGKAEVAMKTAPGSKDGLGNYVSKVGDTDEIRNVDNEKQFIGTSGRLQGKNPYTQYLTIFDGETGAALYTTEFIPYETAEASDWGDGGMKYNRSERYLAAVAYLDGVTPSLIMCRGYYHDSVIRAYNWDGTELTMLWEHVGKKSARDTTLYGQGNHNLSIGDIDNDGKDEIVYGSAALDHDGETVLGNTKLGHGDAMHLNDFNNDGVQEVFSVKEDKEGWTKYAEDLRVAATGKHFWEEKKIYWPSGDKDNGRGVMDNIDDKYAKSHSNALALGWSSGFANVHDLNGDNVGEAKYETRTDSSGNEYQVQVSGKPMTSSRTMTNFLVYWDGDLGRELLDDNQLAKYYADTGYTVRFYDDGNGYFPGSSNNDSKHTPSLVADLWGDWREEVIMPVSVDGVDTALRIFTSTLPTDYRLTTLMHDSQYRMSVAWQNVAYNQPTHTSYYVGSAALATDGNGNELNYLAPETPYTKVTYDAPESVAVTGIELSESKISIEKGRGGAVNAILAPADATKKGITWTSSNTSVATVTNGIIKGTGVGKATITATSKDTTNGTFSASCEVEVYAIPVAGIKLSEKLIELGVGNTQSLKTTIYPANATDTAVKWSSEDPAVATVSEDGTITGLSYGQTNVTVTTADGGKTASCIVKVKPMAIVDATGEEMFESANTDAETTVIATATSGGLSQNLAKTDGEVHKDFKVYSKNKATLEFRLTTGGQSGVGTGSEKWNWVGFEYTMGIKLLDDNGNNILNIYQPYSTKATDLMSAAGDDEAEAVTKTGWNNSGNVSGNIQGSAKRWKVKAEFDYDNDLCTVQVIGTGSDWVTDDGVMQRTFNLNGANFKTLSLYTINQGEGGIKATPLIENVTYTTTEQVSGNTEVLYEKGTDNNQWAENDLTDWEQTGTETAALEYDSANRRVLYNPTKPGAEYNAKKTFDVTPGTVVSYDIDWYFGSAVARDNNYEYLQIGDKLRLGWTNGYKLLLSTDGGATYGETAIFTGENTTYTKNIRAEFNTETKTVTLSFDGKQIYSDVYSDGDGNTADGANSVTLGFTRAGAAPDWAVPNGIDKIRVAQFVYGEEEPCFSSVKITGVEGSTVNLAYDLVDYNGSVIQLIGALYDNGTLVEVKPAEAISLDDSVEHIRQGTDDITFTNNIDDYTLKVFMWDSVNGMQPVTDEYAQR